jgi:Pterin-4a-carbinolamine dehydratase
MTLFNEKELNSFMKDLNGWAYKDGFLEKEIGFNSYMESIKFVNLIAKKAEELNHHPDLHIGYLKVKVLFTSHDYGGVTDSCIKMARETDSILSDFF